MKINCKAIAQKWKDECKGVNAGLAIVQVGDNPSSNSYIKGKMKDCDEIGFRAELHKFPEDVSEKEVLDCIDKLNKNNDIDGIIVQLPLPKHLDAVKITNAVLVEKDVDGFLPNSPYVPCTALGVVSLIDELNIDITGKLVVVLGRSEFIGKRIADMLLAKNATVAICHSKTNVGVKNNLLANADVIIAAVGKPRLFSYKDIQKGTVVIDVGINKTVDGLCGDFNPPEQDNYCDYTTVPGGVGLLTRAMLMKNTMEAKRKQNNKGE